jgi:ribosomal protein L7/L12
MNVSPDIQQQALSLIANNQKIAAVKLIMDHAHCGLKDAKDYADGLHAGAQKPITDLANLDEQLLPILSQGNKVTAIKCYKDATGAGLAESKDYVEKLMQNQIGTNVAQQNRDTDIKNIISGNATENNGPLKSFVVKLVVIIFIAIALTYLMFKI